MILPWPKGAAGGVPGGGEIPMMTARNRQFVDCPRCKSHSGVLRTNRKKQNDGCEVKCLTAIHNPKKELMMKITRGDIYYTYLDDGIGSEQSGYRPVLVVQNDRGNKHSPTVIIAAITSNTTKKPLPTHVHLPKESSGLPEDSIILLEQLRTIDKTRLLSFVCHIDDELIPKIDEAAMCSLGIKK